MKYHKIALAVLIIGGLNMLTASVFGWDVRSFFMYPGYVYVFKGIGVLFGIAALYELSIWSKASRL